MTIKTKLTEKDFIKVNFVLLYKRTVVKVITGIALLLFAGEALAPVLWPDQRWMRNNFLTPIILIGVYPALTWYAAKKNYATNKRIGETI